jgi:hypothetical protein
MQTNFFAGWLTQDLRGGVRKIVLVENTQAVLAVRNRVINQVS